MKNETKFKLISAGILLAVTAYSTHMSRQIDRTIAEGRRKMAEQKFVINIPIPPEF